MTTYSKTSKVSLANRARRSQGLTRLSAGLTRLPTGLRVKTHIKAGPHCGQCGPSQR
jgi:hypothetical protein